VQIVQSIYEGGKLTAAIHAAKATKEQALAQYQTTIADTLLATRVAFITTLLLAAQQITVHEASVTLLQNDWKTNSAVTMPARYRISMCSAPRSPSPMSAPI